MGVEPGKSGGGEVCVNPMRGGRGRGGGGRNRRRGGGDADLSLDETTSDYPGDVSESSSSESSAGGDLPRRQDEDVQLASKTLIIQNKRFYVDVKENRSGRFVKIAEVLPGGRKARLSLTLRVARQLRNHLTQFSEFYASLGPAATPVEDVKPAAHSPPDTPDNDNNNNSSSDNNNSGDNNNNNNSSGNNDNNNNNNSSSGNKDNNNTGDNNNKDKANDGAASAGRTPPLKSAVIYVSQGKATKAKRRYYIDLKENRRGRFLQISEAAQKDGDTRRFRVAIPAQGLVEVRDALSDVLRQFGPKSEDSAVDVDDANISSGGGSSGGGGNLSSGGGGGSGGGDNDLPGAKSMRVHPGKVIYFDPGTNPRGSFVKISQVTTRFRTSILLPSETLSKVGQILADIQIGFRGAAGNHAAGTHAAGSGNAGKSGAGSRAAGKSGAGSRASGSGTAEGKKTGKNGAGKKEKRYRKSRSEETTRSPDPAAPTAAAPTAAAPTAAAPTGPTAAAPTTGLAAVAAAKTVVVVA